MSLYTDSVEYDVNTTLSNKLSKYLRIHSCKTFKYDWHNIRLTEITEKALGILEHGYNMLNKYYSY